MDANGYARLRKCSGCWHFVCQCNNPQPVRATVAGCRYCGNRLTITDNGRTCRQCSIRRPR